MLDESSIRDDFYRFLRKKSLELIEQSNVHEVSLGFLL